MGVKNLFQIPVADSDHPQHGSPLRDIGEEIDLSDMKGHRICVDASDFIYNSLLAFARVDTLTDSDGNSTGHILRIFSLVQSLHKSGVHQVWVFDSPKPNKFKKYEQEKRRERRAIAATNGQEKQSFVMTSKHVNDIKKLLALMGISYMEAPDGIEAEHYGAFLTAGTIGERFCTYMLSADSDVLVFGGNLLRHMKPPGSKKTVYKVYEQDEVLEALGITYDQLLQVAVCLGTDFQSAKVARIGPKTVIKKVKDESVTFTEELIEVMDYMRSDPPSEGVQYIENELDADGLRAFLLEKNFASDRIDTAITVMSTMPE